MSGIKITIENEVCTAVISENAIIELEPDWGPSQYARYFNSGCAAWTKDPECNLVYLRHQQNYATELLRHRGYLFLNEVYDMLGLPRTKAGQVIGWVYDEANPVGDNYVDFGIYNERNEDFVNGYAESLLLDFNVDGNVLDKLPD